MERSFGSIGHRARRLGGALLVGALLVAFASRAEPVVYACDKDGQRVYSDQPCGANAARQEIPTSNRMAAQDTRILQKKSAPAARRVAADDTAAKQRQLCNRNREQTQRLHARMRSGYSAAQGVRYDQRLRELADQYRSERCERYR